MARPKCSDYGVIACQAGCRVKVVCTARDCRPVSAKGGISIRELRRMLECGVIPLPLPPPRGIEVGISAEGLPVFIGLDDLVRHVGIFGSTGAGKTLTAALLASEAAIYGLPVIVLDWSGEYHVLLEARGVDVNYVTEDHMPKAPVVFDRLPLEMSVETFARALGLSEHQAQALHLTLLMLVGAPAQLLAGLQYLSSEVVAELEDAVETARRLNDLQSLVRLATAMWRVASEVRGIPSRVENEIWAALVRRLSAIAFSRYSRLFAIRGKAGDIIGLVKEGVVTILDLSWIRSSRVKSMYSALMLGALYDAKLGLGRFEPTVVVIEEAHNVAQTGSSLIEHLLGEARKHGLGLILVSAVPTYLSRSALSNLNTLILYRGADPEALGLGKAVARLISTLGDGEALLVSTRYGEPIRVRVAA